MKKYVNTLKIYYSSFPFTSILIDLDYIININNNDIPVAFSPFGNTSDMDHNHNYHTEFHKLEERI